MGEAMSRWFVTTLVFLELGAVSVAQVSNPAVESVVNTLAQIRVYSESCGIKVDLASEGDALAKIIGAGASEKEPLERYIANIYAHEKQRASGTCYLAHIDNLRNILEGQVQRATAKALDRKAVPVVGIRAVQ
jgi:hypothetical protein